MLHLRRATAATCDREVAAAIPDLPDFHSGSGDSTDSGSDAGLNAGARGGRRQLRRRRRWWSGEGEGRKGRKVPRRRLVVDRKKGDLVYASLWGNLPCYTSHIIWQIRNIEGYILYIEVYIVYSEIQHKPHLALVKMLQKLL